MAGGPLTPIPQPKPWIPKSKETPAGTSYTTPPSANTGLPKTATPTSPYTNPKPQTIGSAPLRPTATTLPVQILSQVLVTLLTGITQVTQAPLPKPLQTLIQAIQTNPLKPEIQRLRETIQRLNQFLTEFIKNNPSIQKVLKNVPTALQVQQFIQSAVQTIVQAVAEHPVVQTAREQVLQQTVKLLKQGQTELSGLYQSMLHETQHALSLTKENGLEQFQQGFAETVHRLQKLSESDKTQPVTLPRIAEAFQPLTQHILPFIPGMGTVFPQFQETGTPQDDETQSKGSGTHSDFGLLLFIDTDHLGRFHISMGQVTQTQLIFEVLSNQADTAILKAIETGLLEQLARKGFPRPLIQYLPMTAALAQSTPERESPKTALQLLQPEALFMVEIANQLAQWIHELDASWVRNLEAVDTTVSAESATNRSAS